MNTERPLDGLGSIKTKLGVLVVAGILAATIVAEAGDRAGVSAWLTVPATLAVSLLVAQWLARGMTSPLREMTAASALMATGDYSHRVSATSSDEVGELAAAFNTMAADLASADQQRRQLIATVSHELRTPLTAQQALLENLVDGVVQPDDESLRTALAQAERLSALVADLLDLSRVEGGSTTLEITDLDVGALVEQAVAEARAAGTRGVRFVAEMDDVSRVVLQADSARLAQVLANLLDNAERHSPAGGVVAVRAGLLPQERWYLEIADSGPGIEESDRARIFERFGTASAGGTGLGLAIVQAICELHGGTVSVLPAETGARIRAVLPRRPQSPADPTSDSASMTPGESTVSTPTHPATTPPPATSGSIPPPTAPSVVPSLFGSWWPEHDSRPRPGVVLAAVGVGVLAGLLVPHRPTGVAVLVVLVAAGLTVVSRSTRLTSGWSRAYLAIAAALSLVVVLRAAEWLSVICIGVGGVLMMVAITDARHLSAMAGAWASWALAGVRGLPLLGRSLEAMSKVESAWPLVRTLGFSVAALVIFGGLFASGDAIFGSWVSALVPDLDVDGFVERGFVAFVVGGVVLAAAYVAINPPAVDRIALPPGRRVTRAWEWQVPVGVVIAVFALFVIAQASAMWGGHDFIRRTTGLSYADYVHQGFAQLTAATFLTLLTVALAARKAPRDTARERIALRALLGTLCVLALVVVASALYRMSVYQEAYGYTVLRVLVDAFELWLGLVVVLVLLAGFRLDGRWVPRVALAAGALMVLGIALANPEGWVAQRNIDRFEATGKIDTLYLSTLGPDAAPTIADGLDGDRLACALSDLPDHDGGFLNWNLGRARADKITAPDLVGDRYELCPGYAEQY